MLVTINRGSEQVSEQTNPSEDREKRRRVELPATLQLADGIEAAVTIVDMTYNGCKIDCPLTLVEGIRVKLIVPKLGTLDAEVRWCRIQKVGLQFLHSPPEEEAPDRAKDRLQLSTHVQLRRMGRAHYQARVFDLSPNGCKVEFIERPKIGEQLWAKFEGLDSMAATVRWVDGFYGGIEFERPIHPAVFDILRARLS